MCNLSKLQAHIRRIWTCQWLRPYQNEQAARLLSKVQPDTTRMALSSPFPTLSAPPSLLLCIGPYDIGGPPYCYVISRRTRALSDCDTAGTLQQISDLAMRSEAGFGKCSPGIDQRFCQALEMQHGMMTRPVARNGI